MVDVNAMGSDISQGTDDYPAGPEDVTKEWRTPEDYINMSMGSNIVCTWDSNTIYVMINGSEDGQFKPLTNRYPHQSRTKRSVFDETVFCMC